MTIFFLILVIICAVILGFFVLIQNPKGGGLQGNVAGFSNQFMGVKQTTDVLEKGTWIFAGALAVICLVSRLFFSAPANDSILNRNLPNTQQTIPANTTPPATQPAPATTPNK